MKSVSKILTSDVDVRDRCMDKAALGNHRARYAEDRQVSVYHLIFRFWKELVQMDEQISPVGVGEMRQLYGLFIVHVG